MKNVKYENLFMTMPQTNHPLIKLATKNDIEQIYTWLQEEKALGIDDNFLCNWSLTLDVFENQNLFVYKNQITGNPIAYLWADFGILSVKHDYRNKGIGTALANFGLSNLELNNEFAARFQIMPETSKNFWVKMGAEVFGSNNRLNGFIPINSKLDLPDTEGTSILEIHLYPEKAFYDKNIAPIKKFIQTGIKNGGSIWLPERIVFHREHGFYEGDVVARILVDHSEIFFDKAKRESAYDIGIEEHLGYYFVECIDEV